LAKFVDITNFKPKLLRVKSAEACLSITELWAENRSKLHSIKSWLSPSGAEQREALA
jgi:hypothetical protein